MLYSRPEFCSSLERPMRFRTDVQVRFRQAVRDRLLSPHVFGATRLRVAALTAVLVATLGLALGTALPSPLQADQSDALGTAIMRVLVRHTVPPGATWQIATLKQSGEWAYAAALLRMGKRTLGTHPHVVLAHRVNGQWQAAGEDTAAAFNALLAGEPVALLPASTKALLRVPTNTRVGPASVSNVSGYRLPFTLGAFACVVQLDIARTSSCAGSVPGHGYPAIDFAIDGAGQSGDVVAAKDGVVKFRKDASNFGSPDPNDWTWGNLVVVQSAPTEYVWYLHLLNGSIPYALQVGSSIKRGQKIGVEGTTGWSTGVHLHFNIATTYSCCLNPNDQQRIMPYWPGSDYTNMQRVDFDEYPWSVLEGTDIATSQNASPDCSTPSPNANQVALYDLRNYCGAYQVFDIGNYAMPFSWAVQNDSTSAIKVGSNVVGTACVDGNFSGFCQSFLKDTPDLSVEPIGDNQISSLIVATRLPQPPAPSLLAPANGITLSEGTPLTLTWSMNGNQAYGEYSSPPTGLVGFGWQNETYRVLTNLPPGYTYLWHVKDRNSGGESGWSEARAFTLRPAAPSDLTANLRPCGPVDLAWLGHSSSSTSFNIYRNGTLIAQTPANVSRYEDTGATPNSSQQYLVTAAVNGLESDPSNVLSIRIPSCGHFVYIYNADATTAAAFNALISARGFAVDVITPTVAAAFDFSQARTIMVADDATGLPAGTVSAISTAAKPVVGIGQGGASFFGQAGLGLGANASSGSGASVRVVNGAHNVWWFPNLLPGSGLITLFNLNVPYVAVPAGGGSVITLGQLADDTSRAPFVAQPNGGQCFVLWGWSAPPGTFANAGQMLFMNTLLTQPCGSRLQLALPFVTR